MPPPCADHRGVQQDFHAVPRQGSRENLGGVALLPGQEFRLVLRDGDMRAQPAEGLRQFASQRAAADHGEARGNSARSKIDFAG